MKIYRHMLTVLIKLKVQLTNIFTNYYQTNYFTCIDENY